MYLHSSVDFLLWSENERTDQKPEDSWSDNLLKCLQEAYKSTVTIQCTQASHTLIHKHTEHRCISHIFSNTLRAAFCSLTFGGAQCVKRATLLSIFWPCPLDWLGLIRLIFEVFLMFSVNVRPFHSKIHKPELCCPTGLKRPAGFSHRVACKLVQCGLAFARWSLRCLRTTQCELNATYHHAGLICCITNLIQWSLCPALICRDYSNSFWNYEFIDEASRYIQCPSTLGSIEKY